MFIAFAIHFLTPADGRSGRRHVLHVLSVVTASHDNTQKTSHHAASTYQLKQGWQWGGTSLYGKALPCRFWFCLFDRCCWLRYTQATCVQKETMCFAMTVGSWMRSCVCFLLAIVSISSKGMYRYSSFSNRVLPSFPFPVLFGTILSHFSERRVSILKEVPQSPWVLFRFYVFLQFCQLLYS